MIAVLRWTDGFGHDTYVKAIYPTLEQAKQYFSEGTVGQNLIMDLLILTGMKPMSSEK